MIVAHRATPAFHKSGGFTLIELIAAFVIFAIGFGVLLQILSTCLHTTAQSADYTRAALWAQSMLDVQGVGEPVQEGDSSGKFDDKFSWQLQVGKITPPEAPQTAAPVAGNANGRAPVVTPVSQNMDLYQIELDVSWGSYYMRHNARFVTLRAQNPDAGNGNPNFQPPGMRMPPQRGRKP